MKGLLLRHYPALAALRQVSQEELERLSRLVPEPRVDLPAVLTGQQPGPDSEAKAFLTEKLIGYREFANNVNGRTLLQKQANVQAFVDTGLLLPYALEEVTDLWGAGNLPAGYDMDKAHALIRNHIAAVSYDKLGNSYFQGLVYSNGNITASNQISVVGAMVCNGQLTLGNGTSVVYVEDFFGGANPLVVAGGTSLRTWVPR
ncbi:hypothetical protein DYH09_32180 [bacterium CPR1]|nr:hypothetical protein [bacterium CPR1]